MLGWKANFKLVNVHVVKWFPIDWEYVGGGVDLEGGFCSLANGRMKAQVTQIARESLGGKKHKEIMQVVQSLAYVIC